MDTVNETTLPIPKMFWLADSAGACPATAKETFERLNACANQASQANGLGSGIAIREFADACKLWTETANVGDVLFFPTACFTVVCANPTITVFGNQKPPPKIVTG